MSARIDFEKEFDENGRFRAGEGEVNVVFASKGGLRFKGQLFFKGGVCVRASMDMGGDWGTPGDTPLHGIHFLFDLGEEFPAEFATDQGRLIPVNTLKRRFTKREFLHNFRVARNLYAHSCHVDTGNFSLEPTVPASITARSAIWLTPRSVSGFDAADFAELGPESQVELQTAVRDFLSVTTQVSAGNPVTNEQLRGASAAFTVMDRILQPYLSLSGETKEIESVLQNVQFPPWVLNWDFELANDSDDVSSVWINLFVDEQNLPRARLGREVSEITNQLRNTFVTFSIDRWPYVRVRTAHEHMVR